MVSLIADDNDDFFIYTVIKLSIYFQYHMNMSIKNIRRFITHRTSNLKYSTTRFYNTHINQTFLNIKINARY